MGWMVFKEDSEPVWWVKAGGGYSDNYNEAKVHSTEVQAIAKASDLETSTGIPHYHIDEVLGKSGNPSTRPTHP